MNAASLGHDYSSRRGLGYSRAELAFRPALLRAALIVSRNPVIVLSLKPKEKTCQNS
jgi:hypothetical protein